MKGIRSYLGREPQAKCSTCSTLLSPVPLGNSGMLPISVRNCL